MAQTSPDGSTLVKYNNPILVAKHPEKKQFGDVNIFEIIFVMLS